MARKPLRVLDQEHHQDPAIEDPIAFEAEHDEVPAVKRPDLPSPPESLPSSTESLCHLPSLSQLSQTLRLAKYQRRRCSQLQLQLHRLQVTTAQTARLGVISRCIHRTLAECIRSEDKPSFVNLLNALHEAVETYSERPFASTSQEWMTSSEPVTGLQSPLEHLPEGTRTAVLELLTHLRHSGDFVADRLASLTHNELLRLVPDRAQSRWSDSVLGPATGPSYRASKLLGVTVNDLVDVLCAQRFANPLAALVHVVEGHSPDNLYEAKRKLDVWSTVCARLLAEQRPGIEQLIPAVLDIWANFDAWPGKQRLELWILEQLHRGSCLLDQPNKQSFRMRVQSRPQAPTDEDRSVEIFYSNAVHSLLDMLAEGESDSVIPDSVTSMCEMIWRKLASSPGHQRGFSRFVATRWLFNPFFCEAAHGMLLEHYVSEHARSRILREVVTRAQKAVLDVAYAWYDRLTNEQVLTDTTSRRLSSPVPPEMTRRVEAIFTRFEGRGCDSSLPAAEYARSSTPEPDVSVAVSSSDVISAIRALFPQRRPPSFCSAVNDASSSLQSSASSISGFSLFRSVDRLDQTPSTGFGDPNESESAHPPGVTQSSGFGVGVRSSPVAFVAEELLKEACTTLEGFQTINGRSHHDWTILAARAGALSLCVCPLTVPPLPEAAVKKAILTRQGSPHVNRLHPVLEELLLTYPTVATDGCTVPILTELETFGSIFSHLRTSMRDQERLAEQAGDFLGAHTWHERLESLESLGSCGHGHKCLAAMLSCTYELASLSVTADELAISSYEAWARLAKPVLERANTSLGAALHIANGLRDKMWYVADVRTSGPYDEVRSVAGALQVMGRPKRTSRSRMAPPLRHFSGTKASATSLHLKSEAQIVELLSALSGQGGPNKLSDEQARATALWLQRNNIENLCPGEERLHKLCMEVRKCVDRLTAPDIASVPANSIFARDHFSAARRDGGIATESTTAWSNTASKLSQLTLRTDLTHSIDAVSDTSHPLSGSSSREYMISHSPTLTHRSSAHFWSPAITESPSSATSIASFQKRTGSGILPGMRHNTRWTVNLDHLEHLRATLTSLLLSDVAQAVCGDGSETDLSFLAGLGRELADKHAILPAMPETPEQTSATKSKSKRSSHSGRFDFMNVFFKTMRSFALLSSPFVKLTILHQLDELLALYVRGHETAARLPKPVPIGAQLPTQLPTQQSRDATSSPADASVVGFRMLFSDSRLRPRTIFRDLQYIAALVSPSILETSPAGKAFCNAAVALTGLKQDIRRLMVETADVIIAYHSNNRGHGRSASTAQQQRDSATFSTPRRTSLAEDVTRYTMAHAATLLQITAKEGDLVAQRELATLYLTHPELMDHIIAPFARPRDVFKEELESKWRKNQDPNRCDPATMCVAHHWMSLSSKGGDALATEYLRQREEMEKLP
ncbi:hypothetical protein BAUCODRAFT_26074 [Baudoinia panamericana UAMH 10762]|uniref:Uncharacterized protein n=1 Tax=Baudoinia panamericana (strain UAMH 10762) TaxID=717646 RepID=M2MBD4_BAUPA|nr:uncharacterized protein BAUCODRAFT_26074 [Baudoinia panamericana UAMH 10762]EMC93811.1 hypothetical protein BAUCODRAFT_26074 [Baudoinia panamericana UAMH 10762]